MSENTFLCQPAYILHQQDYRESSLLIEALTRDFGRISLVAKGVRKARSKNAALLRPFQPLDLSYLGRSELKTITSVDVAGRALPLTGMNLYCGYFMNELLHHLLHKYDPHPEIFEDYRQCLEKLAQGENMEEVLRNFEFNLMDKIGYGLQLNYDGRNNKAIEEEKKYLFNSNYGLVEDPQGMLSGSALLAMGRREFTDPAVRSEAKMLTRMVFDIHLQGKQLKSRAVLNDIIKRL